MIKCRDADKYDASQPPTCNNGRGCETCNRKWQSIGIAKARARERYNKVR
jgi:hypothetical protein